MCSMKKTVAICPLLFVGAYASRLASNLTVDLGYSIYKGVYNETTGLGVWKGIRYAAAPIGDLRWRAPQPPIVSRNVTSATTFASNCPGTYPSWPNAPSFPGNEDCLFLNVYSPPVNNRSELPVLVWIHGGGYGYGDGTQDLSEIINANDQGFVGVTIQYRLNAFGFLSSKDLVEDGVANAGLLDSAFALKWVQKHIGKFGGDPKRVTISGQSAGAGTVSLLSIAEGGSLSEVLFAKGIYASPYHPAQYDFDDPEPTGRYYDLASTVGCGSSGSVLECLRSKDTETIFEAAINVTANATYGVFPFQPVTDYKFITSRLSDALESGQVGSQNALVGNNADESPYFVPYGISTLENLTDWLHLEFPRFSDADIEAVLAAYPSPDTPDDPTAPKYATSGNGYPTAINVSSVATGHQQRAYDIYSEIVMDCPSYWINDAHKPNKSYHYQYSVPFAIHGADIPAYFGPITPNQSPEFSTVFKSIWGNFIKRGNPSIASESALAHWPEWVAGDRSKLVNLNETGGVPYEMPSLWGNVTQYTEPGLENDFSIANAYTWEGGRGARCEFWKSVASKIPI
ncbi:alpha/beta-hydrolase [Lophiostoma macrostomum CBS 122681]|uniref:Carboxylic ester hydrolase n=1 Tax=Lophiostoma macrostomum CBS 122681 TaxID=1314788 RepID=A0A6A6SVE3_9PLEO|nr:alpha/beta-hydrolase [Lophiostoma macrostomum CBS 122681]